MLRRVLPIDMDDLEMAFDDHSPEIRSYLDTRSGEVLAVPDEIRANLETIYAELPEDADTEALDWPRIAREHGWPEWMVGPLQDADRVERGFGVGIVRVPQDESRDGYRDMEAFIDTVPEPRLRLRLERAIGGRGAFRRFTEELDYHDAEREPWFPFKRDRLRGRIREWLADQGIEAAPTAAAPTA